MALPCGSRFPEGTERIEDGTFVTSPHRVGNMILLCGRRSSYFPFHCLIGPEWPCMCLTYMLIIIPTIFFIVNVATIWGTAVIVIATFTAMLTLVLFSLTACSDPGIIYQLPSEIEPQLEKGEGGMYPNTIECSQCRMARPRTASHCYECGVCVDCLDHHCPWTGKCIAKKNLKTFQWFLMALLAHIIFVIAVIIYSASVEKNIFPKMQG